MLDPLKWIQRIEQWPGAPSSLIDVNIIIYFSTPPTQNTGKHVESSSVKLTHEASNHVR